MKSTINKSTLDTLNPPVPLAKVCPSLPWTTVLVAPTELQLAVPHAQPLGQHPPPTLLAHTCHPLAHVALAVVVAEGVSGTTIVTPLDKSVVEAYCGHDVGLQSRPTRQQPPS